MDSPNLSAYANAEQVLRYRETCKCEHTAIRRRQCADGRIQFVRECRHCFKASSPIRASLAKGNEPFVTSIDWDRYGEMKREESRAEREAKRSEREVYYQSAAWKTVRNVVMKRDNYECQECGNQATEVHHVTYLHFRDERLYELVALCRSCHAELSAMLGHGVN